MKAMWRRAGLVPIGTIRDAFVIGLVLLCNFSHLAADEERPVEANTFSIVAFDPATGELGIAVQSKIVGVGSVVPFAEAGVGAIATQAFANTQYGPVGLQLLRHGASPEKVVQMLTQVDPFRDVRQIGVINAQGEGAAFTGEGCQPEASHIVGEGFTLQGNLLAGKEVIPAMAEAFQTAEGELGARLIAALHAGQKAGGDRRGKQSAALLIVRSGWGYGGQSDRFRDIRVDDHESPIEELERVYELHKKMFPRPKEQ